MIVKDAPYEKRNLGVVTNILIVAEQDKAADMIPAIQACTASYQEMHIPSTNTQALLTAQQYGFKVIEVSIKVENPLKEKDLKNLPGLYSRFVPHLSYHYAKRDEFSELLKKVEQGDMYLTDKIARNPRFGKKTAGRRYSLWLQDTVSNNGEVVIADYKGRPIGFHTHTPMGNGVYMGILGGVYPEWSGKGLGWIPPYAALRALIDQGATSLVSHVSSANPPILAYSQMLGSRVTGMEYILYKNAD